MIPLLFRNFEQVRTFHMVVDVTLSLVDMLNISPQTMLCPSFYSTKPLLQILIHLGASRMISIRRIVCFTRDFVSKRFIVWHKQLSIKALCASSRNSHVSLHKQLSIKALSASSRNSHDSPSLLSHESPLASHLVVEILQS